MFGKPEIEFKARIKPGTGLSHDWGYFKWPDCKAPGGGFHAKNPDMVFVAGPRDNYFDLRAPGYGEKGYYGNGSIAVHDFSGLIVSEEDRRRVIKYMEARKQKEIDKAVDDLARLKGEKAALTNGGE